MDSEAETDTSEQRAQTPSASSPKKRTKPVRRDPNEDILPNWQRRLHVADRMPVPSMAQGFELSDDKTQLTLKSDGSTYAVGEYVFVADQPAESMESRTALEDWGAAPHAFKIGRIIELEGETARVNWLVRPSQVYFRTTDTRELFVTFQTAWISCDAFRGKCVVQCRRDVRMFDKYREKASHFWFSKLYYVPFARTYDVVPVTALRSLDAHKIYELGLHATYAVLSTDTTKQLCEASRKRKATEQPTEELRSEAELEEFSRQRLKWPFRYLNADSKEFGEPCTLPHTKRVGENHQADIPDWPGRPFVYYAMATQNPNLRSGRGIRLVEPSESDNDEKVDITKPWMQEMPSGYIPRGGESTSTPVSLPSKTLRGFVKECQRRYADNIEVHPSSVNFIDACCSILVAHANDVGDAFVFVSHLNRKQLREPDLQPHELATFKAELDPFSQHSWHHVFKAVGSKPVVELCQYYWVNLPFQETVPESQLLCDGQDPPQEAIEEGDDQFECAVCKTDSAPEWKSLPGFVPLPAEPESADKKFAMCGRCARLWYRYKTKWAAPEKVESLQEQGELLEPELVEDMRAFSVEKERRAKRRQAVQEKKEATAKKREETKRVKKALKEATKAGKSVSSEKEALELLEAADRGSSVVSDAGSAAADVKPEVKSTAKKAKTKTSSEDSARSTPQAKSKNGPKASAKKGSQDPSASADDDDSATSSAEEDVTASAADKKSSSSSANQLSLDQVDELVAALDEPQGSENAQIPNYCAVCGQLDPSMPQETCASCGLNVHTACYGAAAFKIPSAPSSLFWLCDCCANSRGELPYDASYQCVMCPPRMPTYGNWLAGATTNAPDVLKNTMDKGWCHLRCAVWTPGARFGNTSEYRDIDLAKVPEDLWKGSCTICKSSPAPPKLLSLPNWTTQVSSAPTQNALSVVTTTSTPSTPLPDTASAPGTPSSTQPGSASGTPEQSDANGGKIPLLPSSAISRSSHMVNSIDKRLSAASGVKLKCELCDERFHVSCAADKGYQLGFTKDASPRPVIVCLKHMETDLLPMSKVDLNLSLSAMQKYVNSCKVSRRRAMPVMERVQKVRQLDDAMKKDGKAPAAQMILPLTDENTRRPFYADPLRCRKCLKTSASYWHEIKAVPPERTQEASSAPDHAGLKQDGVENTTMQQPLVECPLCFRGLNLNKNMHLPTEPELKRLKSSFASKAYAELSR